MALLTLAIALLLERYFHTGKSAERLKISGPHWFVSYQNALDRMFGSEQEKRSTEDSALSDSSTESTSWYQGVVRDLLILLAPPLLLLAVFLTSHHGFVGEFIILVLSVLVLVHSFGPESPKKSLRDFFNAIKANDTQGAYRHAEAFSGKGADSWGQVQSVVSHAVFRITEQRYFAVVIWFALLGPAAALLYRLVYWYLEGLKQQEKEPSEFVASLDAVLQWIPARISGLTYLLAGHMADGVSAVKKSFFDFKFAGLPFVEQVGVAAMGTDLGKAAANNSTETEVEKDVESKAQKKECSEMVRCAIKLSERAGILLFAWIALISLV